MANIITREHFESVAEKVLNGHRDVRSFDFFKGGVRLMIYSRSGRSSWQANLYYCDEDGNYLDRCKVIESAYPYSNTPSFIVDDLNRALR